MLLDNDGNENSILYDARTVLAHDPRCPGCGRAGHGETPDNANGNPKLILPEYA